MKHLALILVTAFIFAACGGEADTATDPATEAPEVEQEVTPGEQATAARMEDGVQVVEIEASGSGYQPEEITLQPGVPARLIFTRTTDAECLHQVQVPEFGIDKTDLPKNEPVTIEFTPDEEGTFEFVCGMDMQGGTVIVRS